MKQTFSKIDLIQLELDLKKAFEEKIKPELKNLREGIKKTKQLVKGINVIDTASKKQKSKSFNHNKK